MCKKLHTGVRPIKCEYCTSNFHNKRGLINHILLHFEQKYEREYEYHHCCNVFGRKRELTNHILHHFGVGKFKCEVCEKYFTSKSHLRRHIMIQSGEKRRDAVMHTKQLDNKM